MKHKPCDYTFLGLCNDGEPIDGVDCLAYLVGLLDTPDNEILDLKVAYRVLSLTFDMDAQAETPEDVLSYQDGSVPNGFYPQTPVMVTKAWSPIGAMLEESFEPIVLKREAIGRAVVAGAWSPTLFRDGGRVAALFDGRKSVENAETVEELFWAILGEAFSRAQKRGKLVCILAKPGWSFESDLAEWSSAQIAQADKILWKRTPEG